MFFPPVSGNRGDLHRTRAVNTSEYVSRSVGPKAPHSETQERALQVLAP
jgi:hypothetical protein